MHYQDQPMSSQADYYEVPTMLLQPELTTMTMADLAILAQDNASPLHA